MLSRGHVKEILLITFANSLFKQSLVKDKELLNKDNKSHKLNKKINAKILDLSEKIDEYLLSIEDEAKESRISHTNFMLKISKSIKIMQKYKQEDISLEFLGLWIMSVNFDHMNKKCHESLQYFKDYDYNALADMMDETKIGSSSGDMFQMSYDIKEMIKA